MLLAETGINKKKSPLFESQVHQQPHTQGKAAHQGSGFLHCQEPTEQVRGSARNLAGGRDDATQRGTAYWWAGEESWLAENAGLQHGGLRRLARWTRNYFEFSFLTSSPRGDRGNSNESRSFDWNIFVYDFFLPRKSGTEGGHGNVHQVPQEHSRRSGRHHSAQTPACNDKEASVAIIIIIINIIIIIVTSEGSTYVWCSSQSLTSLLQESCPALVCQRSHGDALSKEQIGSCQWGHCRWSYSDRPLELDSCNSWSNNCNN